ncbi:tyrosine-type recombinase/integrase [Paracoccus jeotgali]|uniref:tyrosine-type recombinase/integrase n=1 Tax=Paracoccus jeotgali TaxID=2065379 RepID=UPI0028A7619A|nr:integrase arm-type DNA-binding domain-containing protein [Paracoccus jeotgali]
MALTVKQIEAARHGSQKERMSDGSGLYLRLYPSGKKTFQVQINKETGSSARAWVSLGDFPGLGLKDARDLAGWVRMKSSQGWTVERIRDAVRAGNEEVREAPSPAPDQGATFREVAEVWFERKRIGLKNGKHIDQNWNTMVAYAFPKLGSRPVTEITRREVVETLRPIWHSKNETARRTLGRIREVFELAKLEHDFLASPADFDPKVAYGHVRRQTKHFGAVVWERVPEFWDWLQQARCDDQTRQLTMLLVLTAKRTGEARFARARFRDSRTSIWTTPGKLMKRGREHRVPLSQQAETVWENALLLSQDPIMLFGKPRNKTGVICENTVLNLVKGFDPGITGHGFRSSFKGWARAQRRYAHDAIEFALAHRLPPLEEAYLREDLLEERREMMQDWADFVTAESPPERLQERL